MEESRELPRRVEAFGREIRPTLVLQNPPVELVVPEHVQDLPLRVVVRARQPYERRLARDVGRDYLLDQPSPRSHLDKFALFGLPLWQRLRRGRSSTHSEHLSQLVSSRWA
jgi:hypothetical protein